MIASDGWFSYQWHRGFSHGAFTESTTVGLGWDLILIGVIVVIAIVVMSKP
jgi:hypothetical protein